MLVHSSNSTSSPAPAVAIGSIAEEPAEGALNEPPEPSSLPSLGVAKEAERDQTATTAPVTLVTSIQPPTPMTANGFSINANLPQSPTFDPSSPVEPATPGGGDVSSTWSTPGVASSDFGTPYTSDSLHHGSNPAFPFPSNAKWQPLSAIGEGGTTPDGEGIPHIASNQMRVPPMSASLSAGGSVSAPPSRNVSVSRKPDASASNGDKASNSGGPPPAPSAAASVEMAKRGRSASGSRVESSSSAKDGKPTMLGQVQKSGSFLQRMFHKEDKSPSSGASSRKPGSNHLAIDLPRAGSFSSSNGHGAPLSGSMSSPGGPQSTSPSPPGSPYAGSPTGSRSPSRAPSRSASVRHPVDSHHSSAVHASLLADKLSSAAISAAPRTAHAATSPGAQATSSPMSPPSEKANASEASHKFQLKDLLNSAPKLARRPSASSAASKSDHGGRKSERGSEKGGEDGKSTASLLAKYGVCEKTAIGKGATAVVRLAHKWDRSQEKLYAVKEFRKRRKNETEKDYVKKLTSEFCISSTLHHTNIVETVDLVQDENHHWCEVMEYCPGGDLYAAVKKGTMARDEIDCYFRQILEGVSYLHGMGVAHRDIKPENLLLDGRGHVKITDFGVSDVFRMCWEKKTHLSKGLCGSEPYIAPEQFEQKEYDARLVDVWATGVVYYIMVLQELPWGMARKTDRSFTAYLAAFASNLDAGHAHATPAPLTNLPRECRALLKRMLDPDTHERWGVDECLRDPWVQTIDSGLLVKRLDKKN